jgi:hypothetical protein
MAEEKKILENIALEDEEEERLAAQDRNFDRSYKQFIKFKIH